MTADKLNYNLKHFDSKPKHLHIIRKEKKIYIYIYTVGHTACERVNNTMSVQNGGRGGCCYQDVWHRGRDTSRNTTPLEWPGAMPDAGRIILMRYVGCEDAFYKRNYVIYICFNICNIITAYILII